jgi:hypothetical protein
MQAAKPLVCMEKWIAGLTMANGVLGLAMWVTRLLSRGAIDDLPLLPLLGLLSGAMAWRGRLAGHGVGLVFYGVQLATFHSFDPMQTWQPPWSFSLAFVVHLPAGVLIVNAFAVAMLAASAALVLMRSKKCRGQV